MAARCQRNARRSLAKPRHSGELKEMSPLAYPEETIVIPKGFYFAPVEGASAVNSPKNKQAHK